MIGEIADDPYLRAELLLQCKEVNIEKILVEDRDVRPVKLPFELLDDPSIDLHNDEVPEITRCQQSRQCALAGADLQDNVIGPGIKLPDDLADDIIVNKEILPKGLLGFDGDPAISRGHPMAS